VGVIMFLFKRRMDKFYSRIESRFLTNLNAREAEAANTLVARVARKNKDFQKRMAPWDAHIVQLEVPPGTQYLGKPLKDLKWREQYGINIVYIKRGEAIMHVPDRDQFLLPFDQVGIIATDTQIATFKPVFDQLIDNKTLTEVDDINEIVIDQLIVGEHTQLKGKTLRDSRLREQTNGLVIGIERDDERILNPDSATVFEWGDTIWLVGERAKIQALKKSPKAVK